MPTLCAAATIVRACPRPARAAHALGRLIPGLNGGGGRQHWVLRSGGGVSPGGVEGASEGGCELRRPDGGPAPPAPPPGSFDGALSSISVDSLPDMAEASLPPPPDLQGKSSRARWNATHFAFMGDAVWELYMRRFFFHPPTRNTVYSSNVEGACRAEAQSVILTDLMDSGFLRQDELDVVRWARNAKLQNFPKRFRGAGGAQGDDGRMLYRNATCLETLVGYLYVTQPVRLQELMQHLGYLA